MLLLMTQQLVNLMFVGRLGKPELIAAVGMGNMLQNVMGLSIAIGMNWGLETLVS